MAGRGSPTEHGVSRPAELPARPGGSWPTSGGAVVGRCDEDGSAEAAHAWSKGQSPLTPAPQAIGSRTKVRQVDGLRYIASAAPWAEASHVRSAISHGPPAVESLCGGWETGRRAGAPTQA